MIVPFLQCSGQARQNTTFIIVEIRLDCDQDMAPNLASSKHDLIRDMILDEKLKTNKIAEAAEYSERSVKGIYSNIRHYGTTKAPPNSGGRPRSIIPLIIDVLCDHLLEKPGLYLEEMATFPWDEFDVLVSTSSISGALKARKWSKKAARRVAREESPDLRDFYLRNLSAFRLYHLVYIDESGRDKLIGFRRTGWARLGVAPVHVSKFH